MHGVNIQHSLIGRLDFPKSCWPKLWWEWMNGNCHAMEVISCLDSDCHPFPNPFLFTIHNWIPIHCDAVTSKLAEGVMNLLLCSLMFTGLCNVIPWAPRIQHNNTFGLCQVQILVRTVVVMAKVVFLSSCRQVKVQYLILGQDCFPPRSYQLIVR